MASGIATLTKLYSLQMASLTCNATFVSLCCWRLIIHEKYSMYATLLLVTTMYKKHILCTN